MAERMTPAQKRALVWFSEQSGPRAWFRTGDPTWRMIKILEGLGFVERSGLRDGITGFEMVAWSISVAGRAALEAAGGR